MRWRIPMRRSGSRANAAWLFDAAVIALERAELVPSAGAAPLDLAAAADTFGRLDARVWHARALAALQSRGDAAGVRETADAPAL